MLIKRKRKPSAAAPRAKKPPKEIICGYAMRSIEEASFIDGTRQTLIVARMNGDWIVFHFPTDRIIIPGVPSKKYALKMVENILQWIDLHKLLIGCWDYPAAAVPERIRDYIANIYKVQYSISEIPTVKKWLRSNCGSSQKNVNDCRGGLRVKRKR